MVQKKNKVSTISSGVKVKNMPVNYPVLSFVLFLAALFIWFIVGKMFMEMAVDENLCQIRQRTSKNHFSEVVAVVGDEKIYLSEIKDYAKMIPQLSELPFEMIYPQLLETVISSRVLNLAAKELDIENLPDVQIALNLAHEQIIAQAYLDKKLAEGMTEDRLKALYQLELKNFKPAKEVRARHILVKSEQEAKDILIQLKAGAAFDMLAEKYSQDKSASNGDLGYFTEDMMIPEFSRVVFELKKGQISEPIKTPFGWHIAQVEDIRQSLPPSFDDVKGDLKNMLMEQDTQKIIDNEKKRMNVQIKKVKI
jgi:peptidyl-prolyl cis-trans isomerase C